jgi:hypothetical protein
MEVNLLPCRPPGVFNYMDTDSSELRKRNKKKFGKEWKYYNKTITYTNNSNGYRAPEWDQVDWSNSVIVMGCSFVYGIGHDDEDTLPKCIERKLDMPVVNLGAGGTGLVFHIENTNQLIAAGIKPKAVVLLHPPAARFTYFFKAGPVNIGPWDKNKLQKAMWKHYAYDSNHVTAMQHMYSNAISNMWNCPVLKYSFEKEDQHNANIARYHDKAADNSHPGDETYNALSTVIAHDIKQAI